MQIFAYLLLAITVKTSLLGFSAISLFVSLTALLFIRLVAHGVPTYQKKQFARAFKITAIAHLITHHILCAVIAGGLTLYGIRIFLHTKTGALGQKSPS
ncbi:hypothetical protein [Pseudoalteromonas byunsanensis]|uniref:Uncharacterized protein n=1 Tax=Pseudoalteromonas byunsanensis TaxID=327939 RepID=A0A1S1N6Y2_9GAMM|nr:hypothetical protein [Pseudoalteromonas byunsanensis]OHU95092.1 hypothetical protein BIW53_13890 [Pseudoalteromonas byunsanensis]